MENRFETFVLSVIELNRLLQKIKAAETQPLGLQANQVMCLYYLGGSQEGLTAAQLTSLCREDKAAISRALSQLVGKGLVACQVPEHKRAYRTLHFLTDEGRAVVAQVNVRIEQALLRGGSGLSEGQRETFYEALEIILENLRQYMKQDEATGGEYCEY